MRTDEDLMARVAEGDWDALELLLARVERPLFAFLHRAGARPDLVQDLTQEVMVRLYESRRRYDATRAFRPWLFGIAVFVLKDWQRRRGREHTFLERFGGSGAESESSPSPEERAEVFDESERIRRAVQGLPEAERLPLILRHYHGLSYAEIQETLAIPLGTVKTRIHTAVQKLRAAYRGLGQAR